VRRLVLILLIVLAARPVAAAPHPDAAVLRWEAALGSARSGGEHIVARTVADGVPARAEFRVAAGRYRATRTEGAATDERVVTAGHAWQRDWNGWVRALRGRDARDAQSDAFVRELVLGGFDRAALMAAHARTDGDGRLALSPPGGVEVAITFDPVTGLHARATRCAYDDTTTLASDDWLAAGGVRLPFRIVESSAGRADTTWIESAAGGAQGAFARPAPGPSDVRWTTPAQRAQVPFDFTSEHVMVEARVNGGAPTWWLFDTGADVQVVNRARLAELGLTEFGASKTSGGGNAAASAFTRVDSLAVGDVAVVGQRATTLDLTGLERLYGMKLGGILGYDFFSRFVVVVDYDARTFTVLPAGSRRPGGQAVPFVLEEGHPHVRGAVVVDDGGPIATDFVLDSGAAESANLTAPFVRANDLLKRARKTPPPAAATTPGMAGQFFAQTSVRGFLRELRVGPVTLRDVPVNLQQGTSGAYARASFSGTVGQRVQSRFVNTWDYGRATLWLAPGKEAARPFAPRTSFGLSWLADGPAFHVFTVSAVRKDSPAAEAGFARGDTLVALDDRPADGLGLAQVQQALREDGAAHTARVRHAGGGEARLSFTVRTVSIEDR